MKYTVTKEVLSAFQQGNHKAFEVIFLAYYNRIREFIDGFVKCETEAEELTEELFANLWSNHARIDINKSFNSYLHTIAHNAAINFLEHKFVHYTYINSSAGIEYSYSSEDEMIAKETSLLIDMIVEKMPEQRRTIYKLSKKEGLKNEEIAERLQTSKRNVESQLSFALKEIKAWLQFFVLILMTCK